MAAALFACLVTGSKFGRAIDPSNFVGISFFFADALAIERPTKNLARSAEMVVLHLGEPTIDECGFAHATLGLERENARSRCGPGLSARRPRLVQHIEFFVAAKERHTGFG